MRRRAGVDPEAGPSMFEVLVWLWAGCLVLLLAPARLRVRGPVDQRSQEVLTPWAA